MGIGEGGGSALRSHSHRTNGPHFSLIRFLFRADGPGPYLHKLAELTYVCKYQYSVSVDDVVMYVHRVSMHVFYI